MESLSAAWQAVNHTVLSSKVFSTQILATLSAFLPAVLPRNYYSQTRKDAPVTVDWLAKLLVAAWGDLWVSLCMLTVQVDYRVRASGQYAPDFEIREIIG